MSNWFDKEEQQLEDDLAAGLISLEEFNLAMRELQREYTAAAQESAQRAYDLEMERW